MRFPNLDSNLEKLKSLHSESKSRYPLVNGSDVAEAFAHLASGQSVGGKVLREEVKRLILAPEADGISGTELREIEHALDLETAIGKPVLEIRNAINAIGYGLPVTSQFVALGRQHRCRSGP